MFQEHGVEKDSGVLLGMDDKKKKKKQRILKLK